MDKLKGDKIIKSVIQYSKILYHSQIQYHSYILCNTFYQQNHIVSVHHKLILDHIPVYHVLLKSYSSNCNIEILKYIIRKYSIKFVAEL